jgi:hypothetical protein
MYLSPELVDPGADYVAFFAVFFSPAVLIYVFWMINPQLPLGRIRYQAGATDLLHVLQMQARQLNTSFELIGLRNERLANRVALHLALGGGFTPAPTP